MTPHPKTGAPSLPRPQNGRASWLIARRFSSFGKKRGGLAERGGNRIRFAPRVASSPGSDGRLLSNSPCAQPAPLREGGGAKRRGEYSVRRPSRANAAPGPSWLRASHALRPVPHGVLPQSRFARQPPLGGGLCQVAEQEVAPVKSEGSRGSTFRPVVLLSLRRTAGRGETKSPLSPTGLLCSLREAGAAPPRCAASPRSKRNADFGRAPAT